MGPLARLPLYPLLLAAYAVLFVYAANIDEVLPADLWWPLAVALGIGALALALCALLYRDLRRGALLASAFLLALLFFGHISAQLDTDIVNEPMQLAAWLLIRTGSHPTGMSIIREPRHWIEVKSVLSLVERACRISGAGRPRPVFCLSLAMVKSSFSTSARAQCATSMR